MSQRDVSLVEGEYYHVYNRGNSKQIIFKDYADHERFQQLLFVMNSHENVVLRLIGKGKRFSFERGEPLVGIGAYCLMPNHFHILLTPLVEEGIETYMRKVSTGYSMYFNKRYERTGTLFEGRYKSRHADTDEYMKYLFSYIHLNPLKLIDQDWKNKSLRDVVGSMKFLESYPYSSHMDFLGQKRPESGILSSEVFPEYFPNPKTFLSEVEDWIRYKEALLV